MIRVIEHGVYPIVVQFDDVDYSNGDGTSEFEEKELKLVRRA